MWKPWLSQAIGGALGGFASWVLSKFLGLTLPGQGQLGEGALLVGCLFLGMMAAFVGVFISNTREDDLRRLAVFSVLCGMSWRPVLDAGSHYVEKNLQRKEVLTESLSVKKVAAEVAASPAGEKPAKLDALAANTEGLIHAASNLSATSAPQVTDEAVRTAITTLEKQPDAEAPTAVAALGRIGQKALDSRRKDWAKAAETSLVPFTRSQDPSTRQEAERHLQQLRMQMTKP